MSGRVSDPGPTQSRHCQAGCPAPASQCPHKDLPPTPQQPKDNVCGGARSRCPRRSRALPSEGSPGPQHQCPEGASAGGPQDKDPGSFGPRLWAQGSRVTPAMPTVVERVTGASGNLVQQQGRGLGAGDCRGAEEGGQEYLKEQRAETEANGGAGGIFSWAWGGGSQEPQTHSSPVQGKRERGCAPLHFPGAGAGVVSGLEPTSARHPGILKAKPGTFPPSSGNCSAISSLAYEASSRSAHL